MTAAVSSRAFDRDSSSKRAILPFIGERPAAATELEMAEALT